MTMSPFLSALPTVLLAEISAEVWSFVPINRRRDRNNEDVRPLQIFMLAAKRQLLCLTKFFR